MQKADMMERGNFELDVARFIVEKTDMSLFLTGKAGTGKTTFLREVVRYTKKKCIVLAPTGIAAVNAGAMTIHSFFQFGLGPFVQGVIEPKSDFRINKSKLELIRHLQLLIIDEVSMVRADLMDHIDVELRRIRRNSKPFGGVQLLMIGDLQQLPPIAHGGEDELLRQYYKTLYFFSSAALKSMKYSCIELKNVYRQTDRHFIDILNHARDCTLTSQDISDLNARYIPGFSPKPEDGYIRLMTHNRQVDYVNETEMEKLDSKPYTFVAAVTGTFPEESYPTADSLTLKKGAQVMFIKNDPERRFINGTLGEVKSIDKNSIAVRLAESGTVIDVEPMEWQNIRYQFDEGDIIQTDRPFQAVSAEGCVGHNRAQEPGTYVRQGHYRCARRIFSGPGLCGAEPLPYLGRAGPWFSGFRICFHEGQCCGCVYELHFQTRGRARFLLLLRIL